MPSAWSLPGILEGSKDRNSTKLFKNNKKHTEEEIR
jgi:hypothetical protein